jgi:hypothetical protein
LSAVARRYAGLFYSKVGSDGVLWQNNQFSMNVMKSICGDLKKSRWSHGEFGPKNSQRLAETLLYLNNTFGKTKIILWKYNFQETD